MMSLQGTMDPRLRGDDTIGESVDRIGAGMTGSGWVPQLLNVNKEADTLAVEIATSSGGCRTSRDDGQRQWLLRIQGCVLDRQNPYSIIASPAAAGRGYLVTGYSEADSSWRIALERPLSNSVQRITNTARSSTARDRQRRDIQQGRSGRPHLRRQGSRHCPTPTGPAPGRRQIGNRQDRTSRQH